MIFTEKASSYAFIKYINEPYTAVVPLCLLQSQSLKETEIVEVQEGKPNCSVKILLLGKPFVCSGESYSLLFV